MSGFVQAYVFSTFVIDAICFIDFLTRIWINGFFGFWIFVTVMIYAAVHKKGLAFENSRSKLISKLMQLLGPFEFLNGMAELYFFIGLRMFLAVSLFLRGFLRIRSVSTGFD